MKAWAARAARARSLADRYPASKEILTFYAGLADWQGAAARSGGRPADALPGLVDLVARIGPPALREAARAVDRLPELDSPPPAVFFARAARQPFLTAGGGPLTAQNPPPHCPQCGQPPQAGCLRPEGHGLALELVCSLCFERWPFPRARCPACGESADGRSVLYTAAEFPHIRAQACETCKAYLLCIDLARDPQAIPEVDELAGLPLDLWAQEHGYRKLCCNLAGI